MRSRTSISSARTTIADRSVLRDTAGEAAIEWSVLVIVAFSALLPLVALTSVVQERVDGTRASSAASHVAWDVTQNIDARDDQDNLHDAQSFDEASSAPAASFFGDGAMSFLWQLGAATAESFMAAAAAYIPSMLELVETVSDGIAHETNFIARHGAVDYARTRVPIAIGLASRAATTVAAAVLDPVRTAHVAIDRINALGQRAMGYATAIRSAGLSPIALGNVLGPILFDVLLDRVIPGPNTPHGTHASTFSSKLRNAVVHHADQIDDASRVVATAPFFGAMRRATSRRWPELFDEAGAVRPATSHPALLWRLADTNDGHGLLDRFNEEAAQMAAKRLRPDGSLGPRGRHDQQLFDRLVQREYGLHLLDELQRSSTREYLNAVVGHPFVLSSDVFPGPSDRDLMHWTRREAWEYAPGRSVLDLDAGRDLMSAVERAQNVERRLAITAASPLGESSIRNALFKEYERQRALITELAVRVDDIMGSASVARIASKPLSEAIDADLLQRSQRDNFVRGFTFDGTQWTSQASTARDQLAERVAAIAHVERRHQEGETFLELMNRKLDSVAIYTREGTGANAAQAGEFVVWREERLGMVYLVERGIAPPSGMSVPGDAIVLKSLLNDEESVFDFLRLLYSSMY